mmetsp:Transcript_46018/g.110832  ORF Transcript_46018/g.110832 Transcript_46018/m.110832 type:complete len:184 (-) Transcript_46018:87-638(-)
MEGFVEAARSVFKIQFREFGGILVGVHVVDERKVLVCKCARWFMTEFGEIVRETSKVFHTDEQVASAIEWWIGQSMAQLKFWKESFSRIKTADFHVGQRLTPIAETTDTQEEGERSGDAQTGEDTGGRSTIEASKRNRVVASLGIRLDDYIVRVKSQDVALANQTQKWLLSSTIGNIPTEPVV